jgi:hypothetical protein
MTILKFRDIQTGLKLLGSSPLAKLDALSHLLFEQAVYHGDIKSHEQRAHVSESVDGVTNDIHNIYNSSKRCLLDRIEGFLTHAFHS